MPINLYMPFLFFAVVLISFKLPSFLKPEEDCIQKARSPAEASRCSRAFAKLPAKYEGMSLHDAIRDKDMQALQAFIQSGANVNAKNYNGKTPLHLAVLYQPEAVQPLIAAGADVNAKSENGSTPLYAAVVGGKSEAIQLLIDAGADVNAKNENGSTPLYAAIFDGKSEAIQLLIDAGADVNARGNYGQLPLNVAIRYHPQAIPTLIKAGADVNAKDSNEITPLYEAVVGGKSEVIQLLIDAGADVQAKNHNGQTFLDFAIQYKPKAIPALIKAGADVNAKDESGNAPLDTAITHQPKAIPILIEAGARFKFQSEEAQKAFQVAIIQGNTGVIETLIKAGVDIHAEVDGWTPIKLALLSNQKHIVKMLQELGAKINFDRYSEFSRIIPASFYKERSLGIEWEGAVKTNTKRSDTIRNLHAELAERIIKREFSESNHSFVLRVLGQPDQSVQNRQQLLEEVKKHIQPEKMSFFKITDTLTKKTQAFEAASSTFTVNPDSKNPEAWDFSQDGTVHIDIANYKNWENIEIKSPVFRSPEDTQFFLSFLDDMIKKDLLSTQPVKDHSAGLHIHTGTQNLTKQERSLFLEAYLLAENYLFHYFKPHKKRISYAKRLKLSEVIPFQNKESSSFLGLNQRHRSTYFNPRYKTLEFRLFNSTSDVSKIQFQAQFVRALLKGITHNKPQIVEWIQKEWQKRSKNQNLNRDSLDEMFKILNLNPEFS